MFGQTTAVLVPLSTFFTSQFATTCSLRLSLGQPRSFTGAPYARLAVPFVMLGHGRERRPIGHGCFSLGNIGARGKPSSIARDAAGQAWVAAEVGAPENRRGLGQTSRGINVERRARDTLCSGGEPRCCRGHALAARHAVRRIYRPHGQRVRVRAGLGQRACQAGRVSMLARRSGCDGFLQRRGRPSQHGRHECADGSSVQYHPP
jgi:hypothetical protein